LEGDEKFFGDKGYIGDETILAPKRGQVDEVDREVNRRIAKYRVTVEHTFGMIKSMEGSIFCAY